MKRCDYVGGLRTQTLLIRVHRNLAFGPAPGPVAGSGGRGFPYDRHGRNELEFLGPRSRGQRRCHGSSQRNERRPVLVPRLRLCIGIPSLRGGQLYPGTRYCPKPKNVLSPGICDRTLRGSTQAAVRSSATAIEPCGAAGFDRGCKCR
eukprot:1363829-Rhodomonas_salina.3